jgi:hypothetical protein
MPMPRGEAKIPRLHVCFPGYWKVAPPGSTHGADTLPPTIAILGFVVPGRALLSPLDRFLQRPKHPPDGRSVQGCLTLKAIHVVPYPRRKVGVGNRLDEWPSPPGQVDLGARRQGRSRPETLGNQGVDWHNFDGDMCFHVFCLEGAMLPHGVETYVSNFEKNMNDTRTPSYLMAPGRRTVALCSTPVLGQMGPGHGLLRGHQRHSAGNTGKAARGGLASVGWGQIGWVGGMLAVVMA